MKYLEIIITIIKAIIGIFKKKPQQAEQRKFDREDKAEKLYQKILKLDKEIDNVTVKLAWSIKNDHPNVHDTCIVKRRRLLRERNELRTEWERITGRPFTQRGNKSV